jgi:hypothetical protein
MEQHSDSCGNAGSRLRCAGEERRDRSRSPKDERDGEQADEGQDRDVRQLVPG